MVQAASDHHRRYGVLENQLLLIARFEHHRVLIEGTNPSRQLDPADQVDCDILPLFAGGVEKGILDILLRRLRFHLPISSFSALRCEAGETAQRSAYGLYNTA
jgi:hypothetical protein